MDFENTFVLYVTRPEETPCCYAIEGEQIQIGRSSKNQIRIDDQAISYTHCELIRSENFPQWQFRDLGSTNGSELNGESVKWDAFPVGNGDRIVLGKAVELVLLSLNELEETGPDPGPGDSENEAANLEDTRRIQVAAHTSPTGTT